MGVHIHAPQPDRVVANVVHCPECRGCRVSIEEHTPWYGWASTCLGCGNQWQDGEGLPAAWGARDSRGRFDGGREDRRQEALRARKRYRKARAA